MSLAPSKVKHALDYRIDVTQPRGREEELGAWKGVLQCLIDTKHRFPSSLQEDEELLQALMARKGKEAHHDKIGAPSGLGLYRLQSALVYRITRKEILNCQIHMMEAIITLVSSGGKVTNKAITTKPSLSTLSLHEQNRLVSYLTKLDERMSCTTSMMDGAPKPEPIRVRWSKGGDWSTTSPPPSSGSSYYSSSSDDDKEAPPAEVKVVVVKKEEGKNAAHVNKPFFKETREGSGISSSRHSGQCYSKVT